MGSEWITHKLEDCLAALIDYRGKTPHKIDSGIPLVTAKIVKAGRIEAPTEYISEADYTSWMTRGFPVLGDVVMTTEAPLGEVGQILELPVALAQRVVTLRGKEGVLDSDYLLYALQSEGMQARLRDRSTGTTVLGIKQSELRKVEIEIPPIELQRAVVSALKCLDDRIDLLRQTNTTLEAIAQALFKSWFVDFDPVHAKAEGREPKAMDAATAALFPREFEESELGLIPKGWRGALSGTIYEVGIGKTPPRKEPHWFTNNAADVAWASIRDMGAAGVFLTSTSEFLTREAVEKFNVRTVPEGSVLMSFKLTVGRLAIADFDMTTNEAIAHFKPKQGSLPQSFLYCFLRSFDMHSLSSTSSIANATNSKAIRNISILHPGLELAQKFDALAGPLLERIRMQQRQMLTLESLRDTLLPRLISGKLRLPDTERFAEAMV